MAKKRVKKRPRNVPQDKEILNAQEAAIVLGISERLLLRLARDGEIPGKKLGREWRFLRSAIRNSLSGQADEDELMRALSKSGVNFTVSKRKRR
jgi:excisionase family DNA binding protein